MTRRYVDGRRNAAAGGAGAGTPARIGRFACAWGTAPEKFLDLPTFRNEVTLRSMEYNFGYEPGLLIERVSPTPMLMIIAEDDLVCPPDLQLQAYAKAFEPKRLRTFPTGHFGLYDGVGMERSADAAAEFFTEHLA